GRQRALGPAPLASPRRRPPPGRRRPDTLARDRGQGRRQDPHPLRVLDRELATSPVGGQDAYAPLSRDRAQKGAGAQRARRPAALSRPPRGPAGAGARGAAGGRGADGPQREPRRVHRPQLRGARGDSGRRQAHGRRRRAAGRDGRGDLCPVPVRARRAGGGPRDPHERRAARLELSSLADRLRRVLCNRHAVAGLLARGVHAGPKLLRLPVAAPRRRL
ncbi:MAG: Undecaprenyl diphosphate synthase, partial [uncultured Rubrobacteraceae bacterium]